jgi:pimeloyl-ACP methyl ester carboxylesterase
LCRGLRISPLFGEFTASSVSFREVRAKISRPFSREFPTIKRRERLLEGFLKRSMVVLLTLRAECSILALKPARSSRLLPLAAWPGKILILESEHDEAYSAANRAQTRAVYPQARVHTIRHAGHSAIATHTDEYIRTIREFLAEH